MTNTDRDVVASLGQMIARRVGEKRYELWFAKNTKLSWDENEVVVGVPNRFFQEWLHSTFGEHVRAAASTLLGRPMQARFAIDPELFQAARRAQQQAGALKEIDQTQSSDQAGQSPQAEPPRPETQRASAARPQRRWHRLSDFVVGPCNRVAYASALSVVESPGEGANPLVLHGPVGTGKTHLLEGIYAGLRKQHPDWRVCYATAEDFTNRFVQAMRLSKLTGFRKHFRECDALLLDRSRPVMVSQSFV